MDADTELALRRAMAAGDTQAELRLRRGMMDTPPAPKPVEPQYPSPSVLASAGRGAADVGQGLQQLRLLGSEVVGLSEPGSYRAYTEEKVAEDELYRRTFAQGHPDPPMDWARMAGQIGATAPAALLTGPAGASTAVRALYSGMAGGAAGASLFAPNLAERVTNTLGGALGGSGSSLILDKLIVPGIHGGRNLLRSGRETLDRAFAGVTGRSLDESVNAAAEQAARIAARQIGQPFESLGDDVQAQMLAQIRAQLREAGELDPQAVANRFLMQEWGLDPTTGQMTRSPSQWALERNLAKLDVGEGEVNPLMERFGAQNQTLKDTAQRMSGSPLPDAYAVGATAQRMAQMRARLTQRQVGRLYDKARGMLDADLEIPIDDYAPRWAEVTAEWGDAIPGPVKSRIDGLFLGERRFTPAEGEAAIQLINRRLAASPDRQTAAGLRKALEVVRGPLDDMAAVASDQSAAAFQAARRAAAERFTLLRPKLVQDLIEQTTPAEKIPERFVVSAPVDELTKLVAFFRRGTARNAKLGQVVIEGLQAQTDEWLYRQAVGRAGEAFSGTNYKEALRKIGERKLRALYGPEGSARRWSFAEAASLATTTPAGAPVNWSNTAPTLMSYLNRIGARVPMLADLSNTLSGLWRLGADQAEEAGKRRLIDQALTGRYRTPEILARDRLRDQSIRTAGDALVPAGAVSSAALLDQWLAQ